MISVDRVREIRASPPLYDAARASVHDLIDKLLLFMGKCVLVAAVSPEVLRRLKEEYEPGGWTVELSADGKSVVIHD